MKTILTVVLVAVVSTFSIATETSVQAATKNLMTEFSEEMNDDVNKPDNYFSVNEISDIKENVKVTFYVDENQKLVLLKVKTDNNDAYDGLDCDCLCSLSSEVNVVVLQCKP